MRWPQSRHEEGIVKITKIETIWFEAQPQRSGSSRIPRRGKHCPTISGARPCRQRHVGHRRDILSAARRRRHRPRHLRAAAHRPRSPRHREPLAEHVLAGEFLWRDGCRNARHLGARCRPVGSGRPDCRPADLSSSGRPQPRSHPRLQHLCRLRKISRPRCVDDRARRRACRRPAEAGHHGDEDWPRSARRASPDRRTNAARPWCGAR